MNTIEQQFEDSPIDAMQPHPDNANKGNKAVIQESIDTLGFYGAVVVQRSTGYVLAGNHRWEVAKESGAATVPTLWLDVDDDKARRILAVDNRASRLGYDDPDALLALLESFAGDLSGTGYADEDLEALRAKNLPPRQGNTDVDDVPHVAAHLHVESGQVWLLGNNRLAIGDSSEEEILDLALGDEMCDGVWTDPPYGVDYEGGTPAKLRIQGDSVKGLEALLRAVLGACLARTAPGGAWWVAGPAGPQGQIFGSVLAELDVWRQTIVWVKNQFVLGRSDYHYRHENLYTGGAPDPEASAAAPPLEWDQVAYGWNPNGSHTFNGGRNLDTVWEFPRPTRSREHPTMKPVGLIERSLNETFPPGALVLDPFAGSGSTLIAAYRTNRRAALIEKDLRYADVICRRWQQHTGQLPVLEASGATVDFDVAAE